MKLQRIACVCLLSISALVAHPQEEAPHTSQELTTSIESLRQEAGIVGLSVAIIVNKRVFWAKSFGHSDWKRTVQMTPDTVLKVASVSKPMVGVSMLQACHDGLLDLDADVNTYLNFPVRNPHHPSQPITLRQLATHTSGITDRWEVYQRSYRFDARRSESLSSYLYNYLAPEGKHYSLDNFLKEGAEQVRDYSNTGAALAGHIVEQVRTRPLPQLTRERIFEPLGMENTGWSRKELPRRAHSDHFVQQGSLAVPIMDYQSLTYPDGDLRTSLNDLTQFFLMMLNDGTLNGKVVLEPRLAREMQKFQFSEKNRPQNFSESDGNSGLFWRTKFGGKWIGHGGNDPGVSVEMLSNVERSVGVIVMSNTSLSGEEQMKFAQVLLLATAFGEKQLKQSQ